MISHNDGPPAIPSGSLGMLGSKPGVGPRAHHVEYCKMLLPPQILVHSADVQS